MALIIPEAKTPIDPVRQPRISYDQPNLGDGLKQIGDIGVAIEAKRREEERANMMQKARVTAVERLGELRTKYEQDPNVVGLSERYSADLDALHKELAATLPEGKMREDFDLDFRQVAAPQTQTISRREFALRKDAGRADLNAGLRSYAQQAGTAPDDESRDAILKTAAADVGAAVSAGWISEQEAEQLLASTVQGSVSAAAIRTLQDDPVAFLADAKDGKYPLPPEQLARLEVQAKSAIAREEAQLQRALKADEAAVAKQRQLDVDGAIKILEAGGTYDGLPELFDRIAGTEDEKRLAATLAAVGTEKNFTILSPQEQKAVLADIDATPTSDPDDIARRKRLHTIADSTEKSIQTDILTHVNDRGVLQLQPVDLSNPESIKQRIGVATAALTGFATSEKDFRLFTNGERDTLRASVESGDPDAQLSIAVSIVEGFGDYAPIALSEIGASDPLFEHAAQLLDQTGDLSIARGMLVGRKMLKDGIGAKPGKSVRSAVRASISDIYPKSMAPRLEALMNAADAYYAMSGISVDPDASDADKRAGYEQALQMVLGRTMRGNTPMGGVQNVNGAPTLLPPNLTSELVEDTLLNATSEQLIAASVSGGAPMFGGEEIGGAQKNVSSWYVFGKYDMPSQLRDATLLSVGGGQYLVGITRANGEVRYLQDESAVDGFYRLNLEALVGVGPRKRVR